MEPDRETHVLPGGTAAAKRRPGPAVDDVRVVGRYELLTRLGHGGMATVYLGRAVGTAGFEKQVAVKIIHPHLAEEPELLRMFLDEARIAALIHHANVVQTLDLGEDDGTPFIVMELVEGVSLEQLVRSCEAPGAPDGGPLPLAVSLRIIRDVCLGLAAAHDLKDRHGRPQGLVHRDVSPHNILVTFDGWTKIGDFGIAKAASRTGETRPGELRGKLGYMSPEQARGEILDRRTDLYAVGIVLWELLMGRRMYASRGAREVPEGDREVLEALFRHEAPRLDPEQSTVLRGVDPEVLDGLQKVLDRLLAKERAERYTDAHEVSADLGALQRRCEGESEPRATLSRLMKARFAKAEESMRAALQLPPSALAKARQRSAPFPVVDANVGEDTRVLVERRDVDSGPRPTIGARPITQDLEPLTPTPSPLAEEALTDPSRRDRSPRGASGGRLVGGLVVVAVLGLAAVGLAWARPWQAPAQEEKEPPRVAADEALRDAAPTSVTWHVESDPPGAEVWVDGERVGDVTPLDVVLDRSDALVRVEVRLADHRARIFDVAPLGDHSFAVELVPSRPSYTQMATSTPPQANPAAGTDDVAKRARRKGNKVNDVTPGATETTSKSTTSTQPSGFKPMPDFGGKKSGSEP